MIAYIYICIYIHTPTYICKAFNSTKNNQDCNIYIPGTSIDTLFSARGMKRSFQEFLYRIRVSDVRGLKMCSFPSFPIHAPHHIAQTSARTHTLADLFLLQSSCCPDSQLFKAASHWSRYWISSLVMVLATKLSGWFWRREALATFPTKSSSLQQAWPKSPQITQHKGNLYHA